MLLQVSYKQKRDQHGVGTHKPRASGRTCTCAVAMAAAAGGSTNQERVGLNEWQVVGARTTDGRARWGVEEHEWGAEGARRAWMMGGGARQGLGCRWHWCHRCWCWCMGPRLSPVAAPSPSCASTYPTISFFFYSLYMYFLWTIYIYIYACTCSILEQYWHYTTVLVHRSIGLKTMGFTCSCIACTCGRYSVTGDRYGVTQSHLQCDPCYTLALFWPKISVTTALEH